MKPKMLDVIVPVYNTEDYIDRCIESILNQSYYDYNLILIDDGSQDSSYSKCFYYSKNCENIFLIHTDNKGLSSARNLGLSLSNSRYVSFIDSDDWIEKYMFEILINDIIKYNSDIAACNMYSAKSETEKREKNEMTDFINDVKIFYGDDVLKHFYYLFSVCNKIFKRELFKNIKFPVGKKFEDARTTYRLAAYSNIATFNRYNGYNYFQRNNSIINTLTEYEMYDRVLLWNEISEIILKRLPMEVDYIAFRKNRSILEAINRVCDNQELLKKIINEIMYPVDNVFTSDEEKEKILKLLRR